MRLCSTMPDSIFEVERLFTEAANKTLFSPDDSVVLIELQRMNFKLSIVCKMNRIHVIRILVNYNTWYKCIFWPKPRVALSLNQSRTFPFYSLNTCSYTQHYSTPSYYSDHIQHEPGLVVLSCHTFIFHLSISFFEISHIV